MSNLSCKAADTSTYQQLFVLIRKLKCLWQMSKVSAANRSQQAKESDPILGVRANFRNTK
jgi:hypothetical protein